MNDSILNIIYNPYIVTPFFAWLIAQFLKTLIYMIQNKRLDLSRMVGDSGMPSAHTAIVTSLATISLLRDGVTSFQFAVSTVLAVIVCHDARGVRAEVGKQAVTLNEILENFRKLNLLEGNAEQKLKELVGHTPFQVFGGMVTGIVTGLITSGWFPA